MKTAPKKAPGKPQAPKKPSTRSKTGNSACSQAASNWQLAIRGKASLDPDTYKTLGKCRAMARSAKSADDRADMGYNLSEQGRTALKGRLQKRFDEGLITKKSRQDRLKTLLAQRKEKQAQAPATAPAPAKFSRGGQIAPGRGTEQRNAKPKEENIPEVPQWAKDYRSPKPETSKVKANPIKSEYDPETAVSKSGSGMWWVKTVEGGDFPTPFKTKREGIERARLHKEMVSAPAPTTKPTDKATPGENKIPESKQVQAMKNKLERMKAQFDNKIEDWSGQTRGHGGTPFIMDNSKGRAQYKRHQKGDESLRNLDKAIKEQEEKIQAAQYRHIRRHTQTKKSEKFIEKNPVSPGLQYLEQKGLVKSWPKKPEVHFVQGLDKTALITVDGRVGVSRGYNGGSTENFLAAKRLASIANSYNRTQSLVSSVRQNPGYGEARAIAAKNRKLVGLKIRDKGFGNSQAGPAPAPAPTAKPAQPATPPKTGHKPEFNRPAEEFHLIKMNRFLNNGESRNMAYMARIAGTHTKYGLDRGMLAPSSESVKHKTYKVEHRGIYEMRSATNKNSDVMQTEYILRGRNKDRPIRSREQAERLARLYNPKPAGPPPQKPQPGFNERSVYAENTQLPSSMGGVKRGYVARIKGPDPKYKLNREFLKGRSDGAGTNYTITERGIYETQTKNPSERGKTQRIYELHGRNKTRQLMPEIQGVTPSINKRSVERVARLLEIFGKRKTRELRAEMTAMREGAIPLSMKPDKIPRGFEATLASGSQGGKIVTVSKPVKGSDYAAVQLYGGSRSDKYRLVDPKSGKAYPGSFDSVNDAEATAKRVDRLVKRASRGLPQNSSVEEIVTSPGKIGYLNLIRDTVLGRTRKRK